MTRTAAKLALAIVAACCAQAAVAKSSDRQQTMQVQANRSDCTVTDAGPCVLTGNVHIVQGTLVIDAARADIRQGDGDIQSARLTGSPVRLKQEMDNGGVMNATAAQVDYNLQQDTVVFTGKAVVQQPGRGSIAGERIVYNMRTGQVQGGGGDEGGRVMLQFEPRNRAPAGNAPPRDGNDD
ncbi:lipopolysaccharide transport periplasmic protein LptA [Luteimonas sp. M1R5S18]|jgi:lipopolysaccharide export system protein LptA|uniref:Lipopolysaccharide transport periplasmic protein LptA n=1 Tax=Luteimonas rhizosphaericola TaxID=3042024 RepID=A0ABT6JKJ9_9GAMM|nr:lipopolysaccharide transport periplasmic protein LptA [Luteimonas rhizosphaericola]MDH5831164.1 lipopolysaccharide transport periplasmic protein LptA [Luteimonas rhizosphaericola]